MKKNYQSTFTSGGILSPLIRFTLPVLLALVLQAMYGAVDVLVVGRFGDAASISAVGTGSTIMQTVTYIISGFTMGATVLIGRYIGADEPERAGKTIGAAIVLFAMMAGAITAGLLLGARPLARLLQAPAEAMDGTVLYLWICGGGTAFIIAYNVISSIFRGVGNANLPLLFVGIACVVNIIGDLLLTGVCNMGVAGVAIATVLAQAVSVVLSLAIIRKQQLPFRFERAYIRFSGRQIKSIVALGWPIALQNTLTDISFLVVNSLVNGMGLHFSAGYGVAQKVIQFIMLIPSAFMQAVSAFVAQNIGAGQPERAKKGTFYGMATAVGLGLIMLGISFFFGDALSGLFSDDLEVIAQSADYIQGFAPDCVLTGLLFCFIGYFNGCGKTTFVMVQGLCGAFLVRIPLSYLFSRMQGAGLVHMGLATPIATLASTLLCVLYYQHIKRMSPAGLGGSKVSR